MKARRLLPLVMFILLGTSTLHAQHPIIFISSGVKLGVDFDGDFILGFEVSGNYYANGGGSPMIGGALAIDLLPNGDRKLHFGIESSLAVFGLEIGPSYLIKERGGSEWGLSFTAFTAVLVLPYYTYNYFPALGFHEAGVYLKYPMQIAGGDFLGFH